MRGAVLPLFLRKNEEKYHFFSKTFGHVRKKHYLCTAFPPTCFFRAWQKVQRPASLAQLARARDL